MKWLLTAPVFISLGLFWVLPARADFGVQATGFYYSDSLNQTSSSSQARSFYSAELLYSLAKYRRFYFGASLLGLSQSDSSGSTTTNYSGQDYGVMGQFELDKNRRWVVAAGYNLSATANYEVTGSAAKQWSGASYWGRFGYQAEIKNGFYMGLQVTYYNADYNTETVSARESSVTVSRNWILPVISFSYWR